jgi:hypothetical protein
VKTLVALVLLVVCGTACVDERAGPGGRFRVSGGPEFRFAGRFSASTSDSVPRVIDITYMGRTIRYEQEALYVDGRQLTLPARVRVIEFDGDSIRVDGRELRAAAEQ